MNFATKEDISMTPGEARFIEAFNAIHCRSRKEIMGLRISRFIAGRSQAMLQADAGLALAAAPQAAGAPAGSAAAPKAPDEDVVFRFVSDEDGLWRAEVVVPARADPATELAISLSAPEGVLELAGVPLAVEDGKASMPFGMFLAGIRDTNVAFTPANGKRASGHLAFF